MLIELDELLKLINNFKKKGQKIVFTNGCFDILHAGHCFYLNEAKKLGDLLIVGLNTDASIKQLKGDDRPINNEKDRGYILSLLKPVDFVVLFNEKTPLHLIEAINPDVLVKGKDYKEEDIIGCDFVINNGGIIKTIELIPNKSTTRIIKQISKK